MSFGESNHFQDNKQLGVLLAGYLEKQNPYGKVFRRRFIVLTKEAFHWFKKDEKSNLFGEERGQISLKIIETVRILDEDPSQFEILSENFTRRYFRCKDQNECEEWVSAIRSAVKTISEVRKKTRQSIYNSEGQKFFDPTEHQISDEVKVLLVSHISSSNQVESVISRNPGWNRLIFLKNVYPGDNIIISTSNGGTATLSHMILQDKSELQHPFHIPLQNVLLASSLSIIVTDVPHINDKYNNNNNNNSGGSGSGVNGANKSSLFTIIKVIADMCRIISRDQKSVQTIILSSMIFTVGLRCLICYHTLSISLPSMMLFFGLSIFFSIISTRQVINDYKQTYLPGTLFSSKGVKPDSYHLVIQEHQFTSPDAPVKAPEDEIPQRFINGCDGDIREARRRWDITRKWRETEKIDSILNEEQPHFHTIKTMYPHYLCGKGKEGNYVYYERPGEIEIPQLNARGIGIDEMLRHWLFVTEYQYTHVVTGELEKAITVIDIEQVKMSDVAGDALEFVRRSVSIANQHYPERAFLIFLVNVPSWFSFVWKLIKPLVHENTQKKVKILSKKDVLPGLSEHIDLEQIPVYYGGKLDMGGHDSCRFESPLEKAMANYVNKINAKCRGETVEEDSMPITTSSISDGKKLSLPIENKKPLLSVVTKKDSFGKSNRPEDDISEFTPDTDTISTDFSNSRSSKNRGEMARAMLEDDDDTPVFHPVKNLSDEWSISTIGTIAHSPEKKPAKNSLQKMFQSIPEDSHEVKQ